jgi:hypothetical protein
MAFIALTLSLPVTVFGQDKVTVPATSRTAIIEQAQSAKAAQLHPYQPNRVEEILDGLERTLLSGEMHWHPFFDSAYAGGGFTLGAGYARHVSPYNVVDLRGSVTFSGYKRIEAAFMAPRLFNRRASLNAVGGWREATQVGFFGIGNEQTSVDDRATYSFTQPYASANLDFSPTRNLLLLHGGIEISQWNQGAGGGSHPSVEEIYTPQQLTALDRSPVYLHTLEGLALDSG